MSEATKLPFSPEVATVPRSGNLGVHCKDCNKISHVGYGQASANQLREYMEDLASDHVAVTGHTVSISTREVVVRPKP